MGERSTAHTPTGNWTAYESAGFKGEWGVQTDEPEMVAAGDEIIVYPSLCEQHARLIAAAPDLLEALKGMVRIPTLARLDAARAAIAKAEEPRP